MRLLTLDYFDSAFHSRFEHGEACAVEDEDGGEQQLCVAISYALRTCIFRYR